MVGCWGRPIVVDLGVEFGLGFGIWFDVCFVRLEESE